MRGSNTLTLNEATMIEALQEYFDRRLKEPIIKIDGVRMAGNSNPGGITFEIKTSEKKDIPRDPVQHSLTGTGDRA